MNRSFRGLKISVLLISHSLRRKMFLKTLTLSLTIAMPLAQQRLTIMGSRNCKPGKRTQKAWDRPTESRMNMKHPSEDTAPKDDIYTNENLTWKMNTMTKIGVWLLNTSPTSVMSGIWCLCVVPPHPPSHSGEHRKSEKTLVSISLSHFNDCSKCNIL